MDRVRPAGGVTPGRGGGRMMRGGGMTRVVRGHGPVMVMGPWGGRGAQMGRRQGVCVAARGAVIPGSSRQVIVMRETMMTRVIMMVRGTSVVTIGWGRHVGVTMAIVSPVLTMGEVRRALGVMGGWGVLHGAASAAGSVGPGVGGGPAHHGHVILA